MPGVPYTCVCLRLHFLFWACQSLFCPSAQALRWRGMVSGARELPGHLDFSCVCAVWGSVELMVSALLPSLSKMHVRCPSQGADGGGSCHLVGLRWRATILRACVCLGGGHAMDGVFLLYFLITSACRTIASLCTFGCWNVASVATNMYLLRTLACSSHFHFTSMRSHALTFPISSHAQS